jgi:preprotein translocase subunit YajC
MFELLALGGDTASEGSGGNVLVTILVYAVILGGLFYFLLIRPQRTRQKRQTELISTLEVGDEVQTIGGIFGTIEFFDEATATVVLQIEGGGRIRMARQALAGKVGGAEQ